MDDVWLRWYNIESHVEIVEFFLLEQLILLFGWGKLYRLVTRRLKIMQTLAQFQSQLMQQLHSRKIQEKPVL